MSVTVRRFSVTGAQLSWHATLPGRQRRAQPTLQSAPLHKAASSAGLEMELCTVSKTRPSPASCRAYAVAAASLLLLLAGKVCWGEGGGAVVYNVGQQGYEEMQSPVSLLRTDTALRGVTTLHVMHMHAWAPSCCPW